MQDIFNVCFTIVEAGGRVIDRNGSENNSGTGAFRFGSASTSGLFAVSQLPLPSLICLEVQLQLIHMSKNQ